MDYQGTTVVHDYLQPTYSLLVKVFLIKPSLYVLFYFLLSSQTIKSVFPRVQYVRTRLSVLSLTFLSVLPFPTWVICKVLTGVTSTSGMSPGVPGPTRPRNDDEETVVNRSEWEYVRRAGGF